ncbi:outer envelope protein 64, mitochondrial-like isoform X1 [Arachis duranensis]|uniref:Outer envelope protein 64, mitochondrial-like isoform X1 n=1 Tax=Arachis duranensis TaxID=130453 RepID=A0A6P5NDY7_ARADU|nr:outer envelope protein 64, mitochondrial-like isoform X1 [Arachis duranensis]
MNRSRKWSVYIESSFCSYAFNPRVTVPLGSHNGGCVSVSFISFHGADKFLLDTVLDMYCTLQEQVSVASYSLPLPDTNGNIETYELLEEKRNAAFKGSQRNKALSYYTKAIKLNGMNATYYCSRAATYLKLAWYEISPICQLFQVQLGGIF